MSFGPEGYAEWRTPTLGYGSMVRVSAGIAWILYDADLNYLSSGATLPADVNMPAGSFLLLYGPAGCSSVVTVAFG